MPHPASTIGVRRPVPHRLPRAAPALWLDMSQGTYQTNSGYTPAATDGDTLSFVADRSGNGRHAIASHLINAADAPPVWNAAVQNGLGMLGVALANKRLYTPGFVDKAFDRGFALLAVVKQTSTLSRSFLAIGPDTNPNQHLTFSLDSTNKLITFSNGVGGGIGAPTAQYPADVATGLVSFRYDGVNVVFGWNGQYVFRAGSSAFGNAVLTPGNLGLRGLMLVGDTGAGGNWVGNLGEIILFPGLPSPADFDAWEAYLNNKWALYTAAARRVVCCGNSLTYGQGAGVTNSYPSQLQALLGSGYVVSNFGVTSRTTTQMLRTMQYQERLFYRPGSTDIAVVWEITNDIDLGSPVSAATGYQNVIDACTMLRGAGYKVVVCNCVNRGDTNIAASQATINANIAANWATFADAFVDLAGRANLSDPNNATYFNADKIHLTTAGYGEVATGTQAGVLAV
jgi:lysophospholipase L1-like esterase